MRRGAVSANARWDNTVAILTGDFLFSRASNLLADLGPYAVRLQARTFERLVTGQIRETSGRATARTPSSTISRVLADKTGSLIATAAEFGAYFAGVRDAVTSSMLRDFGEQIGVAFQISDDILDIASDSVESGKTPGTDLREGVATLPVLYALRSTDAAGARLRELVAGPIVDDRPARRGAAPAARVDRSRRGARDHAASYADRRARRRWRTLPDVAARGALAALADTVIARTGGLRSSEPGCERRRRKRAG